MTVRRAPDRANEAQRLRYEMFNGKAPVLLNEHEAELLLGWSHHKMEIAVADGRLEDMTFIGDRRYFRAGDIKALMLSGSKSDLTKTVPYETAHLEIPTTRGQSDSPATVTIPAPSLASIIADLRAGGRRRFVDLRDGLNDREVPAPTGDLWTTDQVRAAAAELHYDPVRGFLVEA
jgi:hypothetical protein